MVFVEAKKPSDSPIGTRGFKLDQLLDRRREALLHRRAARIDRLASTRFAAERRTNDRVLRLKCCTHLPSSPAGSEGLCLVLICQQSVLHPSIGLLDPGPILRGRKTGLPERITYGGLPRLMSRTKADFRRAVQRFTSSSISILMRYLAFRT
jgi:hypothetical protein